MRHIGIDAAIVHCIIHLCLRQLSIGIDAAFVTIQFCVIIGMLVHTFCLLLSLIGLARLQDFANFIF